MASRKNVYQLTMRDVSRPVIVGLVAGWAASFFCGRILASMLHGVESGDPSVTLIVSTLFLLAAITAAFLPARKAASIDPIQALRTE